MTANAELIYNSYAAAKSWRGDSATLLYYVSGLDEGVAPDEALQASGILLGTPYPFGTLVNAICMDIRVLERPTATQAWVLVRFDTDTAWGGNSTRLVIEYSGQSYPYAIPVWRSVPISTSLLGPTGNSQIATVNSYQYIQQDDCVRMRTRVSRRVYQFIGGAITDLQINYINQQRGRRYNYGGVWYIFTNASARSNPNGLSVLQYTFQCEGELPPVPANTSSNRGDLDIDRIPPNCVITCNVQRFPRYKVSDPLIDYDIGQPLP